MLEDERSMDYKDFAWVWQMCSCSDIGENSWPVSQIFTLISAGHFPHDLQYLTFRKQFQRFW